MDHELLFSIAGLIAMSGWLTLLVSPALPVWSDRYAGALAPIVLSLIYAVLAVMPSTGEGGFGSLEAVGQLFADPNALLAGWVHFLAFDLLIGAWICRTARAEDIRFWFVVPTLPLTFLYGPIGFLAFCGVRIVRARLRSNSQQFNAR